MELSELRTFLTELQQLDLDNQAGASPDASELTAQLNWAMHWIADQTECCYSDRTPLTLVESQAAYDIQGTTPNMIRIDQVVINGVRLRKLDGEVGLWTMNEVLRENPGYLDFDDGTPSIAFMRDERYLVLATTPNAAMAALSTHYLVGPSLPAELSQESDEPAVPKQYHRHIAYVAAAFTSKPLASTAEGWQRIQAYSAHVASDLLRLRARSKNRSLPSNTSRGRRSDWSTDIVLS
jgi:hypothetical protein